MPEVGCPRVSIVILNFNGLDDTTECVNSLGSLAYPNYDVVVVDNGSRDDQASVLEQRFGGWIRVIRAPTNRGVPEGWNIGIRHALGQLHPQYVLLLNNDVVAAPDFLSQLVTVAEQQGAAACGPKVLYYDSPTTLQSAGGRINLWLGRTALVGQNETDFGQYDQARDVDWLSGCCMLIRAEALRSVGLFDPQYFLYFEDSDWCLRARKGGHRLLFVGAASIWHKSAGSRISLTKLHFMARNHLLFMRKHGSPLQVAISLLYLIAYAVPAWSYPVLVRTPTPVARAVLSAVAWNARNPAAPSPLLTGHSADLRGVGAGGVCGDPGDWSG